MLILNQIQTFMFHSLSFACFHSRRGVMFSLINFAVRECLNNPSPFSLQIIRFRNNHLSSSFHTWAAFVIVGDSFKPGINVAHWNAMFYHSHPKQLRQKRIKCIVSCAAGGYILCVSAMMILHTSQDLHKASISIETDTDADVVQQKQSQLHAGNPVDKDPQNEHSMSNGAVIQETFTVYQYDDNDGAVNTLPKPQVDRFKKKAVGHRKVKRRKGPRYQTPPLLQIVMVTR